MTQKYTRDGIRNFRTFRKLMETIDEGMQEKPVEDIDPNDPDLLTSPEVFPVLPPVVQKAVLELRDRLEADLENRSHNCLDLNALAQAKSAIKRAGGSFEKVVDEDYEDVGAQIRTPNGFKVRIGEQ